MAKPDVKFGDWIQGGFDLYKQHFGFLLAIHLIATILSVVTLYVLAGPMFVGVILVTLALADKKEPKPEIGMLFDGFKYFLPSFLFALVWGLISVAANFILAVVPGLGLLFSMSLSTFLAFGLFLIADRNMQFWPASMESFGTVKQNFFPFLGFVLVAGLIASVGLLFCCIGIIFTLPIYTTILAVAYRDVFGGGTAEATPAAEALPAEEPMEEASESVDEEKGE